MKFYFHCENNLFTKISKSFDKKNLQEIEHSCRFVYLFKGTPCVNRYIVPNYNRPLWGFEMKNQEGEWQYGDVTYDPNTNTMSCMGVTIDVDPSLSVDQNLEGLYEELMNNGFSDGDE